MQRDLNKTKDLIIQWIKEVRPFIVQSFDQPLTIETKENLNDLVTDIDRGVEKFLNEKIHEYFPMDNIVGEEGINNSEEDENGYTWYIDPIDGTMNFVHQKENFCVSVAMYKKDVGIIGVIYDCMRDDFYYAIKGQGAYKNGVPLMPLKEVPLQEAVIGMNSSWLIPNKKVNYERMVEVIRSVRGARSYGSACLELALVATQRLDAYLSLNLSPWDYASGKIIVEELGGVALNLKSEPLDIRTKKSTILIGNKNVCEKILTIINKQSK